MTTSSSDEWKSSASKYHDGCWSGHQHRGPRQRLPRPENWVWLPRLQLPVQQIPGHNPVLGRRLEQKRGEGAQRLIGGDAKPAGSDCAVQRLVSPLSFNPDATVALEQRVHRETVYSELLNRCP